MDNHNKTKIPSVGRNTILKLWKTRNFYDDDRLDMAGLLIDDKNVTSVHHIFGRDEKNKGLAVLGRYFHDYIDSYLLPCDLDEYKKWNNYFAKLYRISYFKKNDIKRKDKLIKECNILLGNILKNKSAKAQHFINKLRPYLNERLAKYIVEAFETTKFTENEFIPRSILLSIKNQEKQYNDLMYIKNEKSSKAFRKYVDRKLGSYFKTEQNSTNLLYEITPNTFEEYLDNHRITNNNWTNEAKEKIELKSYPKYDWMGSIAYPENINNQDYFITKTNEEILYYIENNNQKLYVKWMDMFNCYIKGTMKTKKLLNKTLVLKKKTMEYIYGVVMQPGKTAIRNRIMKKYNEMTEEEKRLQYFETNHDNQIAVAYVFMANQVHRELLEKNDTAKKISLNNNINITKEKFTINLYEYNIDEHVNNDEMGNDFNKDLKKEDFPKDANFLCKDSLDTLKLIRHDTSLFGQWMSYLNFVNNLRKQSMEYFDIKHQRSNTLFSLHKKLYGLRKLTREYFRKKAAQSIDPEEVHKYLYMVDIYREKDIKFYISNTNNFYNSEEFKERYDRYIERREACESNRKIKEEEKKRKAELESKYIKSDNYKNYIKDIYDRKFSSQIDTESEDNSIKLNRPYKTRRMISKNCNHDSMGVCIGCSVEEDIDVVGLLGIDIFITDQSYFILKYLKENYVEVFNSWVLLFNRKASNIINDEEYNNELCELLTKTAIILKNKSNFSNFDRFMRSGALRIGRAAYQMKKTRKKEI